MKKIAVLTGTRAEYGLLKTVMQKIRDDNDLELRIITTGTHLEEQFGYTVDEITRDGFDINYRIPMNLTSDKPEGLLKSMAYELSALAEVFATENFDIMVVLGDRYELLAACECALINRIPIAHIHGGELTHGLIDDPIRHSVTKMSQLHFTSTETYRRRVIQMGEEPERVFKVGALGIENIRKLKYLTREELTGKFGFQWNKPVVMVTFHPVTLEKGTAKEQFESLLKVIVRHDECSYIFTYANADTDGSVINKLIDRYCSGHSDSVAFKSLGQTGYLSTLNEAYFVIGNSSSGLIEVPSFNIPTVNIGDRQGGRIKAESVIDCSATEKSIEEAFEKAEFDKFRDFCKKVKNPYEGENTSDRIVEEIKNYLAKYHSTVKDFYDIDYDLSYASEQEVSS